MTITLTMEKGVYHINLVDDVTQWEIVVCVEGISEEFLLPALERTLSSFPFRILNFHSDMDAKGKEKKTYDVYMTPYDKFKSLADAAQYLTPGITFRELDAIARRMSDAEYAMTMQKQKAELWKNLSR